MRLRFLIGLMVVAGLLAGCGGGDGDEGAGGETDGTEQTTGDATDLRDVALCGVITEATVRTLTGESEKFTTQSGRQRCFWGVPKPGFPAYVEISLARQPGGLDALSYKVGKCRVSQISGVGEEAEGGTCAADPQSKVFVRAFDGEVIATVLVNAPKRALAPGDLVATARAVLAAR
jgi:hypothetical protein